MKIRAADGYYLPSYFFMKIESDENIMECIQNNKQTFVHEFIHFLQDLILPYNIRNTIISNRDFALISSIGFSDGQLVRPFKKWDEDSLLTFKQFSFTWGGTFFIKNEVKIQSIQKEHFEIHTGAKVYAYILLFEDGSHYHIGARDFLEYIAHKIESKHWVTRHTAFPYKSVDILFNYFELDWVSDEVRLCLVEFSLYNDNPMNQLVFVLNDIAVKYPKMLKNYDQCKETLLRLQWNAAGGFNETIFTKTERRLSGLKESLSEKFANNNFSSIQDWIETVINFSKTELANKFSFTELFMLDDDAFTQQISSYLNKIGIPLVFNQKDECVSLLPERFDNNDFIQLYTANKFMDYAKSDEIPCQMLSFCKSNRKEIINNKCVTNPVLRANCEELCPFGAFIKSYGLHEIEWKMA